MLAAVKVRLDRDRCEANGLCVASAPAIFHLDDDDVLTVLDDHPSADQHAAVRAAVQSCPRMALDLTEDPGPAQ